MKMYESTIISQKLKKKNNGQKTLRRGSTATKNRNNWRHTRRDGTKHSQRSKEEVSKVHKSTRRLEVIGHMRVEQITRHIKTIRQGNVK